jgi:uncharacterized membrane protein
MLGFLASEVLYFYFAINIKFVEVKKSYEEDEIYNALLEIRKAYGHDHENSEYDEDYKELIDYLISRGDNGI